MAENCKIVVVGAGILGLTAALTLQEHIKQPVLIIASEFPGDESINYASPWAGAHYRPIPALTAADIRAQKLMTVTNAVLRTQASTHPEAGIRFMEGREYFEDPPGSYVGLQGGYGDTDGFRVLHKSELPSGVQWGCTYQAWSLNSPVYCAFLMRRFIHRGGKTLRMRLVSLQEVPHIAPKSEVVVNCSGVGFGDPECFPTKGQTCLVKNACDRTITQQNKDGSWTFIIPRPLEGGTVIGGTKNPGDWSSGANEDVRRTLLERAAVMYPSIVVDGGFEVIRDIVGRRPTRRGGLRLCTEMMEVKTEEGKGKRTLQLVHAYGAGGSGYELSWGVAKEVANLVAKGQQSPLKASL
ncbi:hypothetical protein H2204_000778 [Knufia peltigerae]|uniref:FAD dependent oxidoreductase domain-containing protein n=1 Tax=Knufia peltigerae TaxID=1002370 RepID=A0AA38YE40_9EURO|nr:hypothetical protein H2204_000778 [Knufia peltigerae]